MSWSHQPLKHLAQVSVSNVDKKSVDGEIPVRLVNYTDVYYGDRLTAPMDLMEATATPAQVRAFRLHAGDVVITKDSETAEDIGIPAFIDSSDEDVVLGYHLALLRPRHHAVDGRFLFWAMSSDVARGQLSTGATGVTRFGLRTDVISSVGLAVPAMAEQRVIADFLDTETARIDALITRKRRMIDMFGERKTATMLAGVSGRLSHSGSFDQSTLAWMDERPSHWREVLVRLVASTGSGHTPSRERPEWWENCTIPWITTGEVAQIRSDEVEVITDTRERISEAGLAGVFAYGNAPFHGSASGVPLAAPVIGMAARGNNAGYWLVAADGGVFTYGTAGFYGSPGGTPLNKPMVGMEATPSDDGYWLVAGDGGIWAYGGATFYGSMSSIGQNVNDVVGMARTPSGNGYWLVRASGGVYTFGSAPFHGAPPSGAPVTGIAATVNGGYRITTSDGTVHSFGP